MHIQIPDHIDPNDLIAAINAGAEAIHKNVQQPADPLAGYYHHTLRDFRDAVVRATRA